MPKKYNRTRNTVTVSANGEFMKSILSVFARESSILTQSLSPSEKTFLNLKLLEKCQEKIYKIKQGQYKHALQNQQETNQILASIKAQTIKQSSVKHVQGSARFIQLNRQTRRRNSDCLISSWTAFVNLDITFKTKQTELLKQNKALHNKIVQMQEKLKTLYPSKFTSRQKENVVEQPNRDKAKGLTIDNIEKIQARINDHQLLILRLKQKIQMVENQKQEQRHLRKNLVAKCNQKYGQEVKEKLERMFADD